ncbi:LysR family transcriptional regulator [Alcaligenaceae bacterium]|nr:LysR family transcriptional regulator [Alcaligenaceae bacterium]
MSIDLRGLRYFVAIATAGSISKASEHLHIAQPALSIQMKQLEAHLGTALMERTYRGIKLTQAGERLLKHAKDILRHVDVAQEDVRENVCDPTGKVALGLPQSVAKILAVPIVQETVKRWPKIQLQIIELNTGYIPDHLIKGNIDLGMTFVPDDNSSIAYNRLLDEEVVFVSSPLQVARFFGDKVDHDTIRLQDLKQFPMIIPTENHSLTKRVNEFLRPSKIKLNVIAEVNAIPQLIELASADIGSTVLSYAAAYSELRRHNLRILQIVEPTITRSVYLCRNTAVPISIATSLIQDLIIELALKATQTLAWPTSMLQRVGETDD